MPERRRRACEYPRFGATVTNGLWQMLLDIASFFVTGHRPL
jgi:hypothetical protein